MATPNRNVFHASLCLGESGKVAPGGACPCREPSTPHLALGGCFGREDAPFFLEKSCGGLFSPLDQRWIFGMFGVGPDTPKLASWRETIFNHYGASLLKTVASVAMCLNPLFERGFPGKDFPVKRSPGFGDIFKPSFLVFFDCHSKKPSPKAFYSTPIPREGR